MWTRPATAKKKVVNFELREVLHEQPPAYVPGAAFEREARLELLLLCVLRPAQLTDTVVSPPSAHPSLTNSCNRHMSISSGNLSDEYRHRQLVAQFTVLCITQILSPTHHFFSPQIARAAVTFLDTSFHFLFYLHSMCKSRPPFFIARRTNALGLKRCCCAQEKNMKNPSPLALRIKSALGIKR